MYYLLKLQQFNPSREQSLLPHLPLPLTYSIFCISLLPPKSAPTAKLQYKGPKSLQLTWVMKQNISSALWGMIPSGLKDSKKNVLLLNVFITVIAKVLKAKTIISISASCGSVLTAQREPVSSRALYNPFSSARRSNYGLPINKRNSLPSSLEAGSVFHCRELNFGEHFERLILTLLSRFPFSSWRLKPRNVEWKRIWKQSEQRVRGVRRFITATFVAEKPTRLLFFCDSVPCCVLQSTHSPGCTSENANVWPVSIVTTFLHWKYRNILKICQLGWITELMKGYVTV